MSGVQRGTRGALKRVMDVTITFVALVLLAPIFLMIAAAILISDGRPIFYRQTRVGRAGTLFSIIKFRTMVTNAHERRHELAARNQRHGPLFKIDADPRVTKIGKLLRRTSLDELPQLFNVLAGTMSLVGPRPCLPDERETFSAELRSRELVAQGMTGLWQLDARHDADFSLYEQLDLQYVREWTLGRDAMILLRTPVVVFKHALRPTPAEPDLEPQPAAARSLPGSVTLAVSSSRNMPEAVARTAVRLSEPSVDG